MCWWGWIPEFPSWYVSCQWKSTGEILMQVLEKRNKAEVTEQLTHVVYLIPYHCAIRQQRVCLCSAFPGPSCSVSPPNPYVLHSILKGPDSPVSMNTIRIRGDKNRQLVIVDSPPILCPSSFLDCLVWGLEARAPDAKTTTLQRHFNQFS